MVSTFQSVTRGTAFWAGESPQNEVPGRVSRDCVLK